MVNLVLMIIDPNYNMLSNYPDIWQSVYWSLVPVWKVCWVVKQNGGRNCHTGSTKKEDHNLQGNNYSSFPLPTLRILNWILLVTPPSPPWTSSICAVWLTGCFGILLLCHNKIIHKIIHEMRTQLDVSRKPKRQFYQYIWSRSVPGWIHFVSPRPRKLQIPAAGRRWRRRLQ